MFMTDVMTGVKVELSEDLAAAVERAELADMQPPQQYIQLHIRMARLVLNWLKENKGVRTHNTWQAEGADNPKSLWVVVENTHGQLMKMQWLLSNVAPEFVEIVGAGDDECIHDIIIENFN